MRIEREPNHAARVRKSLQKVMMQIAWGRMPGVWIGMGDGHRPIGVGHHIHRCFMARMRQIDHHPQAIHFIHNFVTKSCETTIVGLRTTCTKQRLLIVGHLTKPNAKLRQDLNPTKICANSQRVLQPKQDCSFARSIGRSNLFTGCGPSNQITTVLKPAVPIL